MRNQLGRSLPRIVTTAAAVVLLFSVAPVTGQTPTGQIPRMPDGTPDLNGFWQAVNTAHWNLEAHGDEPAAAVVHR